MAYIYHYGKKWRAQIEIAGIRESACFDEEYQAQTWAKARTDALNVIKRLRIDARRKLKTKQAFVSSTIVYTEHEIIEKSTPIPATSGVYFLISNNTIVYVGQSKNVYTRTDNHTRNKEFDRITVIECAENELDSLERFYIDLFKPKLNKVGKLGRNEIAVASSLFN